MKLRRVTKRTEPEYPSFEEHRLSRRTAVKAILGGVAASLGGVFVGRLLAGDKPAEQPPVSRPVEIEGDMAMPEPVKPVETAGAPPAVQPADTTNPPPKSPVSPPGEIRAPEPPAEEPPRIRGEVVAPTPASPAPDVPRIMGKLKAPSPAE